MTLVGEAADDAGGVFDETIALMCEVSGHVCVHVCVCVCVCVVVTMINHMPHVLILFFCTTHSSFPRFHHSFPSTLCFQPAGASE